ncbi:MAG TPA: hypothetical protein VGG70_11890, partial [Candidatus Cybelea sp.]
GSVPSGASSARSRASGLTARQGGSAQTRGWIAPDAKKSKNLIYWGNNVSNMVAIFSAGKNPKQKGQITDGLSSPQRLFVDKSRNLYVTNNGYGYAVYGDITVYAPGTTSPKLTITDGVDNPTGLTVDAAGTVYCANVTFPATITEYGAGKTAPSLTIPLQYNPAEYLAIDASDNLYASTLNGSVWEYHSGSTTGTNLNLQVSFGGALAVDRSGNIVVVDENAATIDFFPAGQTTPSKTISVSGFPFALSLSKDEKKLYATVQSGSEFMVQELKYPGGTTLTTKVGGSTGDWPIAVSPDAVL